MAMGSYKISDLLEKMQNSDKDFRFMATNDLINELEKDSIKLDDESERKVVKALLKLLDDKNGEVQNLVVRCLAVLINKIKENQVDLIVNSLCCNMISEKEQLRDISSVGLKAVIAELPHGSSKFSDNISRDITVCLTATISKGDISVQLEVLDILCDLLTRFGAALSNYHEGILNAIIPQLESSRQAVRKRTIAACGCLVHTCTPDLYTKLIEYIWNGIQAKTKHNEIRTYIQCISTICRYSRLRFGSELNRFVNLIFTFCNLEDEELTETCLQSFETFVECCPKEITDCLPKIMSLCCKFISYDPNYNYDEEDDAVMEMDEDEDQESDQEDYSDNDDVTWKIRRASAKCLEAIITTRHELLKEFYRNISPMLIVRFKEREENVKSDIIQVYIALLRQTKASIAVIVDPDLMEEDEIPVRMLHMQIPEITKAVYKQMREKNLKTRHHCLHLIREICSVVHDAFNSADEIGKIITSVLGCLGDKNSTSSLKIEALSTLNAILTTHQTEKIYPHLQLLVPTVVKSVNDNFYKISSEALNVLRELVVIMRPLDKPQVVDIQPYVLDTFSCTLIRLQSTDVDQEVKDKAICTMGYIICHMGDLIQHDLNTCWEILLARLNNEITRLTTVKAMTKILSSPFQLNVPIVKEAIPVLASFLRKNNRGLKQNSLILIDALLNKESTFIPPELLQQILMQIPPLLHPSDLYVAQWALFVMTTIVQKHPVVVTADLLQAINTQVIKELLYSPMLQGACLKAALKYLEVLVLSNLHGTDYRDLMNTLYASTCDQNVHKQVYYNIAKCLASITIVAPQQLKKCVEIMLLTTQQQSRTVTSHMFALIILGELGRRTDLSFVSDLGEKIIESFHHNAEEVKFAASYALGGIAIGNLKEYLPFILNKIEKYVALQYLLLHSLKDVIITLSSTTEGIAQIAPFVPSIWEQLFKHCECEEEGTRNVVAECLGKLTCVDPTTLLQHLQQSVQSPSPLVRSTVVTAFKYTITDQPGEMDQTLRQATGQFLTTLQDPDYTVRHVALRALNSAAHNKPILIRDLLPTILPLLYSETKVKKELIREVEMGPFKHIVDDGLDMRKAAFECMYTLVETGFDRIDVFDYLTHVEEGLKDHYDIKILTYLIVCRLAHKYPSAVLHRMDKIIEPLKDTCSLKLKVNAVKQEHEKQEELKRSALRALLVLMEIPEADKNPHIVSFLAHIKHSPDLKSIYESIKDNKAQQQQNS